MSHQPLHDILIRRALAADAAAIAAVLYQSFVEHRSSYTPEAFAATTPTSEQIQGRMHEGPVWIALQEGRPVGTGAALPQGAALYIRSMAVIPAARGLGVARALLSQIEQYAAGAGFTTLVLSTTPFLTAAIQLYTTLGFHRSSGGPQDLHGTALFTMTRRLQM